MRRSFLRLGAQTGQVAAIVTLSIVALCALAGLVVDCGRAYYGYQELVASTQAAALAGGSVLNTDTSSQVIAAATQYSALNGDLNGNGNLSTLSSVSMVSGYPKVVCLTSIGIDCGASPANANAIAVAQQATVSTTFLKLVGINSIPLSAKATAAARSGGGIPYNIAIIVDTTASMNSTDSSPACSASRISCALAGVQTLLKTISPCYSKLSSCGTATGSMPTTGNNVANPVDEVSLLAFPGLSSASQAVNDYQCPTKNPTTVGYNASPYYTIVPFSSDFRVSDTATSLVTTSPLVVAAGAGGCSGLKAPGGFGTYYAGVISAAQARLVTQASARPNTKNVMILLSDGAAGSTVMGSNPCHAAIAAAQAATTAGTTVYSVAYGSPSSGCADTTPITPCQTMQQIASTPQNFFSDYNATGGSGSCVSSARSATTLNQIFHDIANDLTVSRLIPNNTI